MTLRLNRCYNMDALTGLKQLETGSVNCCITSPPYYGLRDYGVAGQIGLESTPEKYISRMVGIFREVWRALRDDGTLWLNMGDSYAGSGMGAANYPDKTGKKQLTDKGSMSAKGRAGLRFESMKPKDLMGIPWMLAFALRADGWYLRQDIIWQKPNPMPESVRDRCTKSHEYIFLLSKRQRYYFDYEAIREPVSAATILRMNEDVQNQRGSDKAYGGKSKAMHAVIAKGNSRSFRGGGAYTAGRSFDNSQSVERETHGNIPNETGLRNKRSVWTVSTAQFKEAHFATFPPELIKPCILAGCPEGGTVCDPFMGSGTTLVTANKLNRNCIGFDINLDYCEMTNNRRADAMMQQSLFREAVQ